MGSQVFFVDDRVQDADALIGSLPPGSLWFLINGASDGLSQIADHLSGLSELEAIHLISHGAPGTLLLGSGSLSLANIESYSTVLASIGSRLRSGGDLLVYGCDVGAGSEGQAFAEALAAATGADVAASTDTSGQGGNWTLELRVGEVDAAVLEALDFAAVLTSSANESPVAAGSAVLNAVNEDALNPDGLSVGTLFAANYSDSAQPMGGVVVIGNGATATQGVWQWLNGSTWQSIGTYFSSTNGLFLTSSTLIRFLPTSNFNGSPGALSVRLVDSSSSLPFNGAQQIITGAYIPTYQTPTSGTADGDFISRVSIAGTSLDNVSVGSPSGYTLFPVSQYTASLVAGVSYSLNVAVGSWLSSNSIAAWIDYNQDGDFSDAGEKIGEANGLTAYGTATWAFTLPQTAFNGTTRLRVRERFSTIGIAPEGGYQYGETEDYIVHISGGATNFSYPWYVGSPYSAATVSLDTTVNGVNDAPSGSDKTIAFLEDSPYVLKQADFGFSGNDASVTAVSRTTPISIPSSGAAAPYPSSIVLNGAFGQISSVSVTLTGLSHTWPDDVDILLVGPTGNAVVLMSDAGGSLDVNGVTLTFRDDAASSLADESQIVSGNYKSTNYEASVDSFPAPAPLGRGNSLASFVGSNPNGVWSLYVVDDIGGDSGTIAGGWTLNLGLTDSLASVTIGSLPGNGALLLAGQSVALGTVVSAAAIANGDLTFTPQANANGIGYSSLGFQVQDNGGTSDGGIDLDPIPNAITFNVTPVNDAPVAAADSYSTNEDTPLVVAAAGVLANDTDVEGDSLSAVLATGPSNGIVTLNGDGSFTYTPNANFNGSDSFSYKANDGSLDSGVATVSITVSAVNDAPVATAESYSTNEDTPLVVAAAGVLANDTDVDGDSLSVVLATGPSNGIVTLNGDGSFTYTPNVNFFGSDSFTYKANDGSLDSGVATVSITVDPINDAPTLVAAPGTTTAQWSDPIAPILFTAADVDDPLTALQVAKVETKLPGAAVFTSGLPTGFSLSPGSTPGTWLLNGGPTGLEGVGSYQFRLTVQDDESPTPAEGTAVAVLQVSPEDVRTSYQGQNWVGVDAQATTATIRFESKITDVADLSPSFFTGLATNSDPNDFIVRFINRETGATLATTLADEASSLGVPQVALALQGSTVLASVDLTLAMSNSDAQHLIVGTQVSGFVGADTPLEDTIVTAVRQGTNLVSGATGNLTTPTNLISGGGVGPGFVDAAFYVKSSKSNKNLQGDFVAEFTTDRDPLTGQALSGGTHTYRVKATSWDSAGLSLGNAANPLDSLALFSKANLTDVTDPMNPIGMGGNLNLSVRLRDYDSAGFSSATPDQFSIRLLNSANATIFDTNGYLAIAGGGEIMI